MITEDLLCRHTESVQRDRSVIYVATVRRVLQFKRVYKEYKANGHVYINMYTLTCIHVLFMELSLGCPN